MAHNNLVDMEDGQRKLAEARQGMPIDAEDEAEQNFQPRTLKFWTIIISIFLALFLVALDRTIVSTAVPAITDEFNSMGDIGWYGSAYQLTTAASQLLFGRIYKFYDVKRTFLVSTLIFEVGAALSGGAPNSIAFIIGRAIAGLGGAGIFSGVMIIMISMVPLRKRPMFQGLFGGIFGLASVLGPLVGGAFTTGVTWRWCFFINIPIGCFAAFCIIMLLHLPRKPPSRARPVEHFTRLDPLGTFFFVPSVVCLLLALQWGGSTYSWNNWRIILLMILFVLGMIAFGVVQARMPNTATVPARVITRRSIFAGAIFMFCLAGSMLLIIFFLPQWFQIVRGTTALQSGINTLPFVISMVVASILSGGVTTKIGYYVPSMLLCPSIMAVGLGLMSTFTVAEPNSRWIGYEIIAGFGLGLGMQAANLAAQAVLPKPDIPTGIAIMFFAQQLGGAIFTSVGQNLLSTTLASGLVGIPGIVPSQVGTVGAADIVSAVPSEYQPQVRELYNHALSRIFLCGTGVACVGILAALAMEWKNIKKTGPNAPGQPPQGKPTSSSAPPPTDTGPDAQDMSANHVSKIYLGIETGASFAKSVAESTNLSAPESWTPPPELVPRNDALRSKCNHCDSQNQSADTQNEVAIPIDLSSSHHASALGVQRPETAYTPKQLPISQMSTSEVLSEYSRLQAVARDAIVRMQELMQAFPALPSAPASPQPASAQQLPTMTESADTPTAAQDDDAAARSSRVRSPNSIYGAITAAAAQDPSNAGGPKLYPPSSSGNSPAAVSSWRFPSHNATRDARRRSLGLYTSSLSLPPMSSPDCGGGSTRSPSIATRVTKDGGDDDDADAFYEVGERAGTSAASYEVAREISFTRTTTSHSS